MTDRRADLLDMIERAIRQIDRRRSELEMARRQLSDGRPDHAAQTLRSVMELTGSHDLPEIVLTWDALRGYDRDMTHDA